MEMREMVNHNILYALLIFKFQVKLLQKVTPNELV